MMLRPLLCISVLVAGCASVDRPQATNLAAYCTPQNASLLGSQSRAYFGVCPKESESAFLAGLQRGRELRPSPPQAWPYFERMDQLEKQLLATGSEADRDRIRASLRDAEFWAVHIVNSPGSYGEGH